MLTALNRYWKGLNWGYLVVLVPFVGLLIRPMKWLAAAAITVISWLAFERILAAFGQLRPKRKIIIKTDYSLQQPRWFRRSYRLTLLMYAEDTTHRDNSIVMELKRELCLSKKDLGSKPIEILGTYASQEIACFVNQVRSSLGIHPSRCQIQLSQEALNPTQYMVGQ